MDDLDQHLLARQRENARAPVAEHLADVRGKIADLTRLEAILSKTVAQCVETLGTRNCRVLEMLDGA